MSIAIQGIKGSFHHLVANEYFGESTSIAECMSFDTLVNKVVNGDCTYGVMAIENSIAGAILPNYNLIDEANLNVVGEYFLRVEHNLMALKGQKLSEIKEVYSHPMALLQCKSFFRNLPNIKLVEDKDTAEVAKRIDDKKLMHVGAIASAKAASLYDLDVLEESIQTIKHNETRFIILSSSKNEELDDLLNKASIKFDLRHDRGCLASVLNVISDCGLNLTKIQSLPKIDSPWSYSFFIDVTFNKVSEFEKAQAIIKLMAEDFKLLGVYKSAK
mgnify:CR=1 FL=1